MRDDDHDSVGDEWKAIGSLFACLLVVVGLAALFAGSPHKGRQKCGSCSWSTFTTPFPYYLSLPMGDDQAKCGRSPRSWTAGLRNRIERVPNGHLTLSANVMK